MNELADLLGAVVKMSSGELPAGVPPVSPWWPFLNSVLNAAQAIAIAWLINRARRGDKS